MSSSEERSLLCERVHDRLVEGGALESDPVLAEHLGSCVTCFRAMTELRDAPRVAEALRSEAERLPPANDRFWDDLCAQTTAAVASAMSESTSAKSRSETPAQSAPRATGAAVPTRRGRGTRARIVSVAATFVAAAAGFVLVARGPIAPVPTAGPGDLPRGGAALRTTSTGRPASDEAVSEEEADVSELDAGALRRLLDRMRPSAPAALTASGDEAADLYGDDEGRVNDELADLDGEELQRVAHSLEAGAL
jgi:hypothetical protein